MPTCSIDIQPDRITAKLAIKVLKNLKKTFPVPALRLDHASTTQKRGNPAGNIQSFLMLAVCGNFQPPSDERPASAEPGMQGKTAFILENNGFFRPQRFEFFLGPWRTSSRLRLLPGDTHGWLASSGTRVYASSTAPGEPLALPQSDAVNGSPASGRPIELDSNRTSGAIAPDGVPTGPQFSASSVLGARAVSWGSRLRLPLYLPPASSGSRSSGFGPEPRISTLVAALPVLEAEWRSLCRSMLLELSRLVPTVALSMPYVGLKGRYSCLPV